MITCLSQFAIVETNSDPSKVNYNGVTCDMSVYEPKVSPSQYSSGEMIIQNGNDRIQVGWMVSILFLISLLLAR